MNSGTELKFCRDTLERAEIKEDRKGSTNPLYRRAQQNPMLAWTRVEWEEIRVKRGETKGEIENDMANC